MGRSTLRIAVIGGGVAGCAVALMLGRRGQDVQLFEQSERVGPVGAGVLLQPSGQRVLSTLSLLDDVVARAERIDELVAYTHRGAVLSRFVYGQWSKGCHAYGVHRGELFGVLFDAMVHAGVRVRLNQRVVGVTQNRDAVRVSHGRDASTGPFDVVIVADGARSRLRDACQMRYLSHAYAPSAWWTVGPCPGIANRLFQRARDTRQLCGLLPMGAGRCSFFWGTLSNDRGACTRHPFDRWKSQVLSLMPEAEPIVGRLRAYDEMMFATYRAVFMPRPVKGRIVFIGDAAHAASPLLGQGVNLGLQDATDLTDALTCHAHLPDALHAYDRKQRWRNAWYTGMSALLMPSFQGTLAPLGFARDVALPMMQKVRPLNRLMLATLVGSRSR
jgi:2-polyprenyl-6-methoxyphenol hydroxylase-like FAD-dependent oxidoreductase